MLNGNAICDGIFGPFYDKDLNSRLSRRIDFFRETAARSTFFSDDGLWVQSLNQRCGVIFLVINEMVDSKARLLNHFQRFVSVQDAEPAFMLPPVITQFRNSIDTS